MAARVTDNFGNGPIGFTLYVDDGTTTSSTAFTLATTANGTIARAVVAAATAIQATDRIYIGCTPNVDLDDITVSLLIDYVV